MKKSGRIADGECFAVIRLSPPELVGDDLILRLLQLPLGDRLLLDVAQFGVDRFLHRVDRFPARDGCIDDVDSCVFTQIGLRADVLRDLLPVYQ